MKVRMDEWLKTSPDVLGQRVRGETVLLDLAGDQYFGLDEVGGRIWRLLGRGSSCAAIVDALLEEYEVERERLEQDVLACVEALAAAGLVRPSAPPGAPERDGDPD